MRPNSTIDNYLRDEQVQCSNKSQMYSKIDTAQIVTNYEFIKIFNSHALNK